MQKQRDSTFDFLKGIAIISMIAGHSAIPLVLHDFIYLWHMPLFFIVSGYFYRQKSAKEMFMSTWRGLLLPYVITSLIIVGISFLVDICIGTHDVRNKIVGQLAINGLLPDPMQYGNSLYEAGPIWFLLALAWCRILYAFLCMWIKNEYIRTILVLIISYSAFLCGKNFFLPFFLWQSMISMVFYHIGHLLKLNLEKINAYKKHILFVGVLAFIIGMVFHVHLDIWGFWFSCWPINIFIATFLSISIYLLSRGLKYTNGFVKSIALMGRLSILLLVIHTVEIDFKISENLLNLIPMLNNNMFLFRRVMLVCQFAICLCLLSGLSRIKYIRLLYNIK